jgi:hypothetical protein
MAERKDTMRLLAIISIVFLSALNSRLMADTVNVSVYSGRTANNQLLVMRFTFNGTAINGSYSFDGPKSGIGLKGQKIGADSFALHSVKGYYDQFTGLFKGSDSLIGTWIDYGTNGMQTFRLHRLFSYQDIRAATGGEGHSHVISLEKLVFHDMASKPAQNSINAQLDSIANSLIAGKFHGKGFPQGKATDLQQQADQLYDSLVKGITPIDSRYSSLRMSLLYERHNILSVGILSDENGFGPYNVNGNTYYNFDLNSGKCIKLADLLDHEKEISVFADSLFRRQHRLPQGSLKMNGYFTDSITLTDNFYPGSEGIIFFYKPAQIAPYSFGPFDLELPYSRIKKYVCQEGLLNWIL